MGSKETPYGTIFCFLILLFVGCKCLASQSEAIQKASLSVDASSWLARKILKRYLEYSLRRSTMQELVEYGQNLLVTEANFQNIEEGKTYNLVMHVKSPETVDLTVSLTSSDGSQNLASDTNRVAGTSNWI